jgi:hypothetical protein
MPWEILVVLAIKAKQHGTSNSRTERQKSEVEDHNIHKDSFIQSFNSIITTLLVVPHKLPVLATPIPQNSPSRREEKVTSEHQTPCL